MSSWWTSDTHFFHTNIIKYCNRPFETRAVMNEIMVERWNEVVRPGDFVYHAGDFALMNDVEKLTKLIERLNGKIHLMIGSHDASAMRVKNLFADVKYAKTIEVRGQLIFMAHCCHKVWDRSHYGSWHLYGHSHGGLSEYAAGEGKLLDIGVDSHDFRPWSEEELFDVMATRPNNFNFIEGGKRKR